MTDTRDHYQRAIAELKAAAEETNCGYCKQISNDAADGILKKYLDIQDTMEAIDQVSTADMTLMSQALTKARGMLSDTIGRPANDKYSFTVKDMFPMGILPGRFENRPRINKIMSKRLIGP